MPDTFVLIYLMRLFITKVASSFYIFFCSRCRSWWIHLEAIYLIRWWSWMLLQAYVWQTHLVLLLLQWWRGEKESISWGLLFLCEGCFSRYFTKRKCSIKLGRNILKVAFNKYNYGLIDNTKVNQTLTLPQSHLEQDFGQIHWDSGCLLNHYYYFLLTDLLFSHWLDNVPCSSSSCYCCWAWGARSCWFVIYLCAVKFMALFAIRIWLRGWVDGGWLYVWL